MLLGTFTAPPGGSVSARASAWWDLIFRRPWAFTRGTVAITAHALEELCEAGVGGDRGAELLYQVHGGAAVVATIAQCGPGAAGCLPVGGCPHAAEWAPVKVTLHTHRVLVLFPGATFSHRDHVRREAASVVVAPDAATRFPHSLRVCALAAPMSSSKASPSAAALDAGLSSLLALAGRGGADAAAGGVHFPAGWAVASPLLPPIPRTLPAYAALPAEAAVIAACTMPTPPPPAPAAAAVDVSATALSVGTRRRRPDGEGADSDAGRAAKVARVEGGGTAGVASGSAVGALEGTCLAIIVPFRDQPQQNRMEQLARFATDMPRFLASIADPPLAGFHIIVVEQSRDGYKFNRGKLLNAGFRIATAADRADRYGIAVPPFTSFCFHDVDLLPSPPLAPWYRMHPSRPIHIAWVWGHYGYDHYTGGILSFSRRDFEAVNG